MRWHREACKKYRAIDAETPPIQLLVEWMADHYAHSWTAVNRDRDSADRILEKMAELGIIRHANHPMGGHVWIMGNKLFGRTDGIKLNSNGKVVRDKAA